MSSAPADIPVDTFTHETVNTLIAYKDNKPEQDKCIREWDKHIRSATDPVLFWDFLRVGPAAGADYYTQYEINKSQMEENNDLKVLNNTYEILCDGDGLIGTCTMDQRLHRSKAVAGPRFYEIQFNIIKKKRKGHEYENIKIPRYHSGITNELSPHKVIANASGIEVPDNKNQYLLTFESSPILRLDNSRSNTLEKILKNIQNGKPPYDGMIPRAQLTKQWGVYETNSQFFWGNATIQKIQKINNSTPGGGKSRKNKKRLIKKKSYNRRRRSRNISLNKRQICTI